jgi:hypothetical protein
VDPEDVIPEQEEANNARRVFTDALSVGFWVEETVGQVFRWTQPSLNIASTSIEDYLHRHIERFNEMAAAAVYPEAPQGVLDRLRVEYVKYVPDGATDMYDYDLSVDLAWLFPASRASIYHNYPPHINIYNGSLLHELGHNRNLVDVYATRVFHDLPGHSIEVREGEELVAGSPFLPFENSITHYDRDGNRYDGWKVRDPLMNGLMANDYTYIDRYSAAHLNLLAGHRSIGLVGSEDPLPLDYLPGEMRLRVRDADSDAALAGASVSVYRGEYPPPDVPRPVTYPRFIDDVVDLEASANNAGVVSLGSNPFADGDMNMAAAVALVRVEHHGLVGYAFLDAMLFNLAYWRGETAVAELDFPVHFP